MKNLITIAKKILKPVAIIKYLFFPFMIAGAQGTTDLTAMIGKEKVVAQVQTQTSVWVATNSGLYRVNRINGKFVHLTTDNSVLPSNHIKGICATSNENVYVATDKGLFRFDGSAYLLISTENANLPTNDFTSITCDERDRVFVGTKNHGLVMIQNYKCKTFDKSNSALTSNAINKVYCDENGIIIAEEGNGNMIAIGVKAVAQIINPQIKNNEIANGN